VRLRAPQFAIAVIAAGVLTFGVVFSLLTFSPSAAAPDQPLAPTEVPTPTPMAVSADSLAPRVSSDNLAVGFALAVYPVDVWLAALTFGVVSIVMSLVGLEVGHHLGKRVEEWSEEIGGGVLILVGVLIAVGVLG